MKITTRLQSVFSRYAGISLLGASSFLVPAIAHADTCTGVLVCHPDDGFTSYLKQFLDSGMTIVFTLALALIIYSGVQYMMGGLTADNSKKAKQRIIGSITGVVFYLLIRLILNQLGNNLLVT